MSLRVHKTQCSWCNKSYSSVGAYANHLSKKHPSASVFYFKRRKIESDVGESNETNISDIYSFYEDSEEVSLTQMAADANLSFRRFENFPTIYSAGLPIWPHPFSSQRSADWNPLYLFYNATDYKLAHFFSESKVPKTCVDAFFKDGLANIHSISNPTCSISFCSGYTLQKQCDKLIDEPRWKSGEVDFGGQISDFYYRDLLACVPYLLHQKTYAQSLVWAPIRERDHYRERVYSELHTGTWW